jgi:hypothetical protein
MMTTAGQSACAAQEEVLQCCDHLYLSRKITDNQLLYLRHLVLIREEEVAEVYDEFQVHRDLDRMFRELHRIANTHPKNPEDEDDEDDEDADENDAAQMTASPAFATTLGGVLSLMHRAQLVTPAEAMLLNHMIITENEFLLAAHELFVHDGDINELQDTMIRCAKLVTRRMNERQEHKDEEESEEEDNESEDESDDDEEQSNSQLDEILNSVGVQNTWSATVPPRFILAVFAAAQKDLLAVGQARALCDLYQAKYDLVRAAWEVYNVQGDVVDFTDTLRRIVRDLNFRDDGNVQVTSSSEQKSKDVFTAVKESKDRTEAAFNNKQEAVLAVAEAKQELLRHSLEMMVKQEIIAGPAAQSLYDRAARGDPLTDAAIEAYASDRNIMEFLDTLQILANNTPEEINRIMRSAVDEDGDDASSDADEDQSESTAESDDKTDDYDDSDFEDDDEENGSGQELDLAQKKLYEVVLELVEEDMINSGTATILMTLINNRDDRVMAAYDVYSEYEDKDDLVDSLLRVARKELQEYLSARSAQEEDEGIEMSSFKKEQQAADRDRYVEVEMTQMKNPQDDEEEEEEEANEGDQVGLLNSGDQASILDILAKAGAIESHHAERIIQLINENNVEVKNIFLEYERKKDVYHLIENLRSFMEDSDAEEEQEEDEEVDNDDDEEEEDSESIETRFLNIIQEMNLSHLETAALRLAIARDDFAIRSALEMFRVSRDEAELIETLRSVAKKTIDTTLTEAGYDGIQDEHETGEGGDEEEDDDVEDENDDDDDDDNTNDNDDGDDDSNDDDDDDDEDDNEISPAAENDEGGLMSTQSAREYIFPILLSELVKEKVIGEDDGEILRKLFSNGDAVVNAALDVYDLDSDMAELVDTLQKVARSQ